MSRGGGGRLHTPQVSSGFEKLADLRSHHSPVHTENDSLFTPEQRAETEVLLQNTTVPYQVSLYSGTSHGFGVRANVSDFEQRYGKESAFLQAVRWFQVMGSAPSQQ